MKIAKFHLKSSIQNIFFFRNMAKGVRGKIFFSDLKSKFIIICHMSFLWEFSFCLITQKKYGYGSHFYTGQSKKSAAVLCSLPIWNLNKMEQDLFLKFNWLIKFFNKILASTPWIILFSENETNSTVNKNSTFQWTIENPTSYIENLKFFFIATLQRQES